MDPPQRLYCALTGAVSLPAFGISIPQIRKYSSCPTLPGATGPRDIDSMDVVQRMQAQIYTATLHVNLGL